MMRHAFQWIRIGLALVVGVLALGITWASWEADRVMSRTYDVHADHGSPESSADRVESIERGRRLLEARYPCADCHGADFSGGTMVDAFPMGRLLGPNLTDGVGTVVSEYTYEDWDRIVRHGVKPDGTPSIMPSIDFREMSDQELADIVHYIASQPAVDNEVPTVKLGPLGMVLVATGQIPLSADELAGRTAHRAEPPATAVDVEFGAHLAAVCAGCHGPALAGGPIRGGNPSWAPASNLTQHADGLADWTLEDFRRLIADGVSRTGAATQAPMDLALPLMQRMTDVEVEALWLYLESLEPLPTGG
ncbi:MAG: c-type cytochrome [Gemmatimonadota bacterium]